MKRKEDECSVEQNNESPPRINNNQLKKLEPCVNKLVHFINTLADQFWRYLDFKGVRRESVGVPKDPKSKLLPN